MHCKQYHTNQCHDREHWGDHWPNDGRYKVSVCRLFFDKMSSNDRLATVGWLTPDDRATFGRCHDVNFFKRSAVSPMTKPWKSADRTMKLLTLMLRQKNSSADQNISQNWYRRQPIFPKFAHRPSGGWLVKVIVASFIPFYIIYEYIHVSLTIKIR